MFYAANIYCPEEVAIFSDPDARDIWVHHLNDEPPLFPDRMPLSVDQAYKLVGERLYNDKGFYLKSDVLYVESQFHDGLVCDILGTLL